MDKKIKKPLHKKWWVWLIAVVVIVAVVTVDDEEDASDPSVEAASSAVDKVEEDEKESESDAEIEEETNEAAETADENKSSGSEADTEADKSNRIDAVTYKIGEDIPAGEYLVFASGMGYIESASDSTGALESIVFNDNLMNGAHSYVTLNEGEYFKLQSAEMYPVKEAPSVIPDDGIYSDGMYKVGQDIPAGEYKIILDSSLGMGYLEVSSDSSHQLGSIVTNENVQADTYLTISEGQYLKLQDVKIEK
ncbi:hypothetical protein QGM71_17215 [Virgibacillus sp. C22-A2]|uniref:Uncharacterized protein n=1 Tax=Virgibacillus tibetensis TaxID=3042313 RepID=A0ABU6KJ68_9BACI|nr:hypothetical protein [Virgibacillus sp. C22-A2]